MISCRPELPWTSPGIGLECRYSTRRIDPRARLLLPVLKQPDNVNGRLDNIMRVLDFQLSHSNDLAINK